MNSITQTTILTKCVLQCVVLFDAHSFSNHAPWPRSEYFRTPFREFEPTKAYPAETLVNSTASRLISWLLLSPIDTLSHAPFQTCFTQKYNLMSLLGHGPKAVCEENREERDDSQANSRIRRHDDIVDRFGDSVTSVESNESGIVGMIKWMEEHSDERQYQA